MISKPVGKESARVLYPQFVQKEDVVVEVGTFLGGGTTLLASLAKQVYSFEPVKLNFERAKMNTSNFKNVKLFNLAVGRKSEQSVIHLYWKDGVEKAAMGASSLVDAPKYWKRLTPRKDEEVHVVALDDVKLDKQPTVLISNCEGSERLVLDGAVKTLNQIRDVLVEVHNTLAQLDDFSSRLEFRTS